MSNCRNCGAPIDIKAEKCPYCDTYYKIAPEAENSKVFEDVNKWLSMGVITINEARKLIHNIITNLTNKRDNK